MNPDSRAKQFGTLSAAAAYVFLGLTPLYWRQLAGIPPLFLLVQRVLWSAAFLSPFFFVRANRRFLAGLFSDGGRQLGRIAISAGLMATNWYFYVIAVLTHRVLDASLAYFLSPLGNVVIGVLLLGERVSRARACAIALAILAVGVQAICLGKVPLLVFILAGSITLYGFVKRPLQLPATVSVGLESCLLTPVMLVFLSLSGTSSSPGSLHTWLWIALSGPVTALPLIWLAVAIPRIPFSLLGLLFYLTPAVQFLLAICLFGETFAWPQKLAFGLIWIALGVFSWELVAPRLRAPEKTA